MPLMQIGYGGTPRVVRRELEARLEEAGLSSQLASTFPFAAPIKAALSGGSPFWIELAIEWLQSVSPTPEIVAQLDRYRGDKRLSQRVRTRIARLLQRTIDSNRGRSLNAR
jgi:hypothetical protein